MSQALKEAEEQWRRKHKNQQEENGSGPQRMEELQEELAALQSQLEQVTREQAALLKAELAGARAAWNRDKQQEIAIIQARSEQVYQAKLQEQYKKLEQAVLQAREDADLQKNELLLQMEAKLQQEKEKEMIQGKQIRDELQAELQTALAEVQAQLLKNTKTDHQGTEDTRRTSRATSEATITHIIQTSCRDIVQRAVAQAKKEWKTVSCYISKEYINDKCINLAGVQKEKIRVAREMSKKCHHFYYKYCNERFVQHVIFFIFIFYRFVFYLESFSSEAFIFDPTDE